MCVSNYLYTFICQANLYAQHFIDFKLYVYAAWSEFFNRIYWIQ